MCVVPGKHRGIARAGLLDEDLREVGEGLNRRRVRGNGAAALLDQRVKATHETPTYSAGKTAACQPRPFTCKHFCMSPAPMGIIESQNSESIMASIGSQLCKETQTLLRCRAQ